MPTDEYSTAVSGGLKLKGVNPSSKVSKHKKKKPKPETNPSAVDKSKDEATTQTKDAGPVVEGFEERAMTKRNESGDVSRERDEDAIPPSRAGKTEAELRHDERRRKRLDERLKREGTKTHKERVEELNRYLSNLSEHHDMPRIGPG